MTDRISIAQYREILAQPPAAKRDIKAPKKARKRKIAALGDPRPAGRPSFLQAIMRLMSFRQPARLRLKPEEQLSIAFATALRELTIAGRLRCVWTHPANEIAGRRDNKAQIRYAIAKAMGLIDGTADYLFLWNDGSGALEAKVGKNGQQPNQVDFEVWCAEMSVPYATFTSVEEGLEILTKWGVIRPSCDTQQASPELRSPAR